MTKAEEFIELYKKLEHTIRDVYSISDNDSISYYLQNKDKFKKYRDNIQYCQRVRNLLQHNEKINDSFAVEPSNEMLMFIKELIQEIRRRTKCNDIAIGLGKVYHRTMSDNVSESIKQMRINSYTHIPILENGVVIGVFDENSIFNYLADDIIIDLDGLIFQDIKPYLSITDREMVSFDFVSPSTYIDELVQKFETQLKKGKRMGMIFLTPSGKSKEKLTGILTPWDILGMGESNHG